LITQPEVVIPDKLVALAEDESLPAEAFEPLQLESLPGGRIPLFLSRECTKASLADPKLRLQSRAGT